MMRPANMLQPPCTNVKPNGEALTNIPCHQLSFFAPSSLSPCSSIASTCLCALCAHENHMTPMRQAFPLLPSHAAPLLFTLSSDMELLGYH
eukprot:scaffold158691_cov17-Tisochrysis_lutea.AAC.1